MTHPDPPPNIWNFPYDSSFFFFLKASLRLRTLYLILERGLRVRNFLKKHETPFYILIYFVYVYTSTYIFPILRLGCVKKSNFLRCQYFATFSTCHFCFGFCSLQLSFFNKYAKYAPFWKAEILIFQVQVDLWPQQPSKFFYLKQKF